MAWILVAYWLSAADLNEQRVETEWHPVREACEQARLVRSQTVNRFDVTLRRLGGQGITMRYACEPETSTTATSARPAPTPPSEAPP